MIYDLSLSTGIYTFFKIHSAENNSNLIHLLVIQLKAHIVIYQSNHLRLSNLGCLSYMIGRNSSIAII